MHRGYIKLWRKSLDSAMMRNPKLWMFWCWCLLSASHEKHTVMVGYQAVELEPGQFVFGRRAAAQETHLTEQTIRTCLESLKTRRKLTIKSTSKFSIITIENWGLYQGNGVSSNQQSNPESNQQVTSKQPASNQQVTTNKNGKNGEKREEPPIPPEGGGVGQGNLLGVGSKNHRVKPKARLVEWDEEFLAFYEAYPKHEGKVDAQKAWRQMNGKRPPLEELLQDVERRKETEKWTKDGGRYIPGPAPYLRGMRWEDEIVVGTSRSDKLDRLMKGAI